MVRGRTTAPEGLVLGHEITGEVIEVGPDVEFVKVAMQPGMPQGSGRYTTASGRAVPIVTLPGNPVSAQVSFEIFVRPPLRAALRLPQERPRSTAVLTDDLRSPRGKRQFRRGVVETAPDGTLRVQPIGPPSSRTTRRPRASLPRVRPRVVHSRTIG